MPTATKTAFEPVIGLEVHTELDTASKIFCSCTTRFGAPPNSHTCPVCLGMPGVLPVLNRQAVEHALRVALALQCEISNPSVFERKNYYYPDLPKNYQISQLRHPLGKNGKLEIFCGDTAKTVRIIDVHLEEDAGKLLHPEHTDDYTLVDLNRAGLPLLEIISAPDMTTVEEVEAYMEEIRRLLRYVGASQAKMEQGQLRFEVNISLRPTGESKLGTRVEIKNLNSFRAVHRTIEHEISRQARLLGAGDPVEQETRLWDEAAGKTLAMRRKEVSHDYRYFPEPDLVPLVIDQPWIDRALADLPELPSARRRRFIAELGLSAEDARTITAERALGDYFEACIAAGAEPKSAANWITGRLARRLREGDIEVDAIPISAENLAELIALIDKGTLSPNAAREVFDEAFSSGKKPSAIVEAKGLAQIGDDEVIVAAAQKAIDDNPDAVEKFRAGDEKIGSFFMGQVMKATRGRANPQKVQEILRRLLAG